MMRRAQVPELEWPERRPPGNYIANQCPTSQVLVNERLKVLLRLSTNMLSSFADAGRVAVVDLFVNETARRCVCSLTAIRHEPRIDRQMSARLICCI